MEVVKVGTSGGREMVRLLGGSDLVFFSLPLLLGEEGMMERELDETVYLFFEA